MSIVNASERQSNSDNNNEKSIDKAKFGVCRLPFAVCILVMRRMKRNPTKETRHTIHIVVVIQYINVSFRHSTQTKLHVEYTHTHAPAMLV